MVQASPRAVRFVKPQGQTLERLLRCALEDWCWIGLLWYLMLTCPQLWLLWAVLVAGRLHALGVLLHDLAHMPIRRKPIKARFVELLCGYPVATTLEAMRFHHLRHHAISNTQHDPYYHVYDTPWDYLKGALRGLLIIPAWTIRAPFGLLCLLVPQLRNSYTRVFMQDKSGKDRFDSREVQHCAREEAGQVLFQLLLLGLCCWQPDLFTRFYLVPVMITGVLSQVRLMHEHNSEILEQATREGMLRTTRDHNLGWLGQLLLAPHNVGHHVTHHLYPGAGFHELPRLTESLRSEKK